MFKSNAPSPTHSAPTHDALLGGTCCNPSASKGTAVLAAVWLVVVLTGSLLMAQYSQTAGAAGEAPVQWPAASVVLRDSTRAQLVMFLHPRCPCSRASISELEQIVAHCQGKFSAQVLFIQPEGVAEDWVKTDLWHAAAAIPGVKVGIDYEGQEARRFQAITSGQTLLYAAAGGLMFQGGITLARGHAGDNPGRDAIESLLNQTTTHSLSTPVFGCALGWNTTPEKCSACQP